MALRRSEFDKLIAVLEKDYSPQAVRALVKDQRDVLEDILHDHGDLLSSTIVPQGFLRKELERRARKAAAPPPTNSGQPPATPADSNPDLGESRPHLALVSTPAERKLSRRQMEDQAGFRRDRLNWRQRRLCAYIFKQTRVRGRPSVPLLARRLAKSYGCHPKSVQRAWRDLVALGYLRIVDLPLGQPVNVTLGFQTVGELKSIAERVRPRRRKARPGKIRPDGNVHVMSTYVDTNSPQPVATAADDAPSFSHLRDLRIKIKTRGLNFGLRKEVNKTDVPTAAESAPVAAQSPGEKPKSKAKSQGPRISYRWQPPDVTAAAQREFEDLATQARVEEPLAQMWVKRFHVGKLIELLRVAVSPTSEIHNAGGWSRSAIQRGAVEPLPEGRSNL